MRTYVIVGIIVVLALTSFFAIREVLALMEEVETTTAMVNQNKAAYEDQLNQQADSIQTLAVAVEDLNSEAKRSKEDRDKYFALSSSYKSKLDSIQVSGSGIVGLESDSLGQYGKVTFSGRKLFAYYSGWTKYYIGSGRYFWDLSLGFDTLETYSDLIQENDLWKIRTVSLTPGVKIMTRHAIDSTLFVGLRSAQPKDDDRIPSFGLRLKGNVATTKSDIEQKNVKGLGFDVSAEAYYKYYNVTYYPLTGVLSGGFVANFDIGRFLSRIF